MEGRYIEFADGTQIGGDVGYAESSLWLYTNETDIPTVCAILADPEKTRKITFHFGDMLESYEGFTSIQYIALRDGLVYAMLKKGESEK